MDNNEYEKKIIYVNSDHATFSPGNDYNMIFDIVDTIKDVVFIKVLKSEVIIDINGLTNTKINNSAINDSDPIFISLNDFYRITTQIGGNSVKYFDMININLTEKFGGNVPTATVSFKNGTQAPNFCNDNSDVYRLLNDTTMKKLNISLYDKNNKKIQKVDIKGFNMTLCVYCSRKKTSQF